MKSFLLKLLMICLGLSLCGCATHDDDSQIEPGGGSSGDPTVATSIVIYYDFNDNLIDDITEESIIRQMADEIAMQMYADTFSIKAKPQYPLDEAERDSQIKTDIEQETVFTFGQRLPNMNQYDRIYLGFPVCYQTLPQAVAGFLQSYDFSSYEICLFAVSDNGQLYGSIRRVQELTGAYVVEDCLCVEQDEALNDIIDEVDEWLKSLPKKTS